MSMSAPGLAQCALHTELDPEEGCYCMACGPSILEKMQSKDADMKTRVASVEYKLSNIFAQHKSQLRAAKKCFFYVLCMTKLLRRVEKHMAAHHHAPKTFELPICK